MKLFAFELFSKIQRSIKVREISRFSSSESHKSFCCVRIHYARVQGNFHLVLYLKVTLKRVPRKENQSR